MFGPFVSFCGYASQQLARSRRQVGVGTKKVRDENSNSPIHVTVHVTTPCYPVHSRIARRHIVILELGCNPAVRYANYNSVAVPVTISIS